jgi:cytochrome P450
MRFALLEIKIALIELLKRYTFVRAPDTEVSLSPI